MLCFFSCTHIPFHLKIALYGFSLAYLNCQHDYSCTLGPLLSKIRMTEHRHCSTATVNLRTWRATNWVVGRQRVCSAKTLGKGMSHPGWDGAARLKISSCYSELRNLKLTNCLFLESDFFFWLLLTMDQWNHGKQNLEWGWTTAHRLS